MNYLITGGGGFIGRSLVRYLKAQGHQVHWTSRKTSESGDPYQVSLDLLNSKDVESVVQKTRPEVVVHLAAASSVKDSFTQWETSLRANYEGSFSVFEAVQKYAPKATVISAGSSAEYGAQARSHQFLEESLSPLPSSPYALSKAAQASLVEYFHRVHGLKIIHVRPFAVIGAEKRGDFISDLLTQALACKKKEKSQIELGEIHRERDFIDIDDFCKALDLIIEKGAPGTVYNMANGISNSFSDVIHLTSEILEIPLQIKENTSLFRVSDDQRLIANISRLKNLGYTPKFSLKETLQKILQESHFQLPRNQARGIQVLY